MAVIDDVLTSGSERGRGRLWSWVDGHWLLLGVVAGLIVVALAADQLQERREMEALLTQVTSGEQTIDAASGSLQVVLDYYNPVLYGPGGASVRDAFTTDIAEAAEQAVATTTVATNDVASVSVLPWHRALRQARSEYQARVEAWNNYLATLAAKPESILAGASDDQLPSTKDARDALREAVPRFAGDTADRIDQLLEP